MIAMKEKCNWKAIGTLVMITLCLSGMMIPVMPQPSISLFNNGSNATDREIGETHSSSPTPVPSPSPSPTQSPALMATPTPESTSIPSPSPASSPTPTESPSPGPSPAPLPSPSPSPYPSHSLTPTPTPGPTPTLTPVPSPTLAPIPSPSLSPAAPNITSFAPTSHVCDTEGAPRTFSITIDKTVNVSWLLNGTEVQTNESVTDASYTNTNPAVGIWNVSAIATNENGTAMQTWIWTVSQQATLTPSPSPTPSPSTSPSPTTGPTPGPSPLITPTPTPNSSPKPSPSHNLSSDTTLTPFYIFGWVHYENSEECHRPIVNITNMNTSKSWEAETSSNSSFFHITITNISEGDMLQFNITDGTSYNATIHETTWTEMRNGGLFNFNLTLPMLAPWVAVEVTPDDDPIAPGVQVVNINLTTNKTVAITANVTNLNGYQNIKNVTATITGPDKIEDSPISLKFVSNSSLSTAIYKGIFNMSYHAEGDYKVEVTATNTANLSGIITKNFTYSYGPDLVVTNISAPTYLVANKSNTINATIRNNGTARASECNVSLIVADENETIDTVTVPFPSLNASDNASVNFNWIPPLEGNYILTIMADSNYGVNESNETNNNFTSTVLVGVPDFAVTKPNLNLTHPLDGDIVNITVSILNKGIREGNCTVKFLDVKSEGSEVLLKSQTISLPPGGNESLITNWNATIGNHTILVQAINSSLVPDGNMENNENETTINVTAFDFIISTEPSTFTPILGRNVTINATIENIGDRSKNVTVMVGFYLDNNTTPFEKKSVLLNTSGKNYTTAVWNADTAGKHIITAEVDPYDIITELSESNNNKTIGIFVNGTDLAVTDIDIPCFFKPCFEGREVPINITIANLGAIGAANFTIYVKEGIGEENTSGSVFFSKTITTQLNSGDNVSIPVNWMPEKWGYYTITVSIPHDNTDNNKANNEMWKEVPVYAKYEFAVEEVNVVNASGYPNGVVREGENVSINATIKNLGMENGTVNVSFYVNSTDFVGSKDERYIEIGRTEKPIFVEAGKTNNTPLISWSANVTGGDHLIYAVVNPDNELTEWPQFTHRLGKSIILKNQTLAGNNVKSCTLHVIKPDLKLKTLTLDPPKPVEGDLVNLSTAIKNEGYDKVNSTVWFFMEDEISKDISRTFISVTTRKCVSKSSFPLLVFR